MNPFSDMVRLAEQRVPAPAERAASEPLEWTFVREITYRPRGMTADVLRSLVKHARPMTARELSDRTGAPSSVVESLLRPAMREGIVRETWKGERKAWEVVA